jgi:hypothetical protein
VQSQRNLDDRALYAATGNSLFAAENGGEGQNRTVDTTIFKQNKGGNQGQRKAAASDFVGVPANPQPQTAASRYRLSVICQSDSNRNSRLNRPVGQWASRTRAFEKRCRRWPERRSKPCCDARGMRDDEMLLLELKWATAHPIRSARDLARFVSVQPLYSNR